MKKLTVALAAVLILAVGAAGCGSKHLLTNPAYHNKLDLKKDQFLIMPVDFHGFPMKKGARLLTEAAIFGGFVATFGKAGIPLQPIKKLFEAAGFANLSWWLAHGVYHVASAHHHPNLAKDSCGGTIGQSLSLMAKFVNWVIGALKTAGVPIPADYKVKYVVLAHVDRISYSKMLKLMKYRVIGGIVDVTNQQIVASTWFTKTSLDKKVAYVAALATLGSQLLKAFKPVFVQPPKKKKG